MSGQQIGSIIGAAVGAYFGGPSGAQLGMAIGGAIGGAVDPTHINGPKIGDGQQQAATDGNPIAWVQGTAMIAGTIVQVSSRRQIRHKDNGKGGSTVQVTFTAVQDFAILVCESCEIRDSTMGAVLMVIQDGKLVYDVRPGTSAAVLSDSAKWKANVDFLFGAEDQLPHPTLEASTGVGNTPAYRGSLVAVFKSFDVTSAGDRIPNFQFVVAQNAADVPATALASASTSLGIPNGTDSSQQDRIGGGYYELPLGTGADREVQLTEFDNNSCHRYVVSALARPVGSPTNAAFTDAQVYLALSPGSVVLDTGWYSPDPAYWLGNGRWEPLWVPLNMDPPVLRDAADVFAANPTTRALIAKLPAGTQSIRITSFETGLSGRPASRVDVYIAQSSEVLSYLGSDGRYANSAQDIRYSPWSVDQSGRQTETGTALTDICSRICLRGGLSVTDIDTAGLAGITTIGYPIARQSNAADCLLPLLQAYFGYASEYDGQLRFKLYGANAAVVVDRADLIEGNDSNNGAIVSNLRNQSTEFPRRVVGSYMDPAQNYTVVDVAAERRSVDVIAIGDQSFQIPVVMVAGDAAKAVDKALKVAYATLEGTLEYSVPFADADAYLSLAAGEPLQFQGKRYVLDEMMIGNGSLKLTMRYDRQSAYTSNVQAITGNVPTPPSSPYSGPTIIVPMNLPSLRPQDTYGVYLAAASSDGRPSWSGCTVQVSYDGQANWQNAATITQGSVLGALALDEPGGGEPLTVQMNGDLETITDAQLAANANAFALIGATGTEVGQFKTATELGTPDEYELTDVARGELSTTRQTGVAGDQVVMLDAAYFLPVNVALAGATLYFRAVGFGENAEDAWVASLVYSPDLSVIHDGGTVTP